MHTWHRIGSIVFLTIFILTVNCQFQLTDAECAGKDRKYNNLSWCDEFEQENGSAPNQDNWTAEIGNDGWGNNELEYYTERLENACIKDGCLVITARQEDYQDAEYTSARLVTRDKVETAYGRVEARIMLPKGQGIWPAFWMLGSTGYWPQCGEIDIMENVGNNMNIVYGSLHVPNKNDTLTSYSKKYKLPRRGDFSQKFHLFAIEWDTNKISYFVDSKKYMTVQKKKLPAKANWVFDNPFYIILNVAIGGDWPGSPDSSTVFPQNMYIDYVRIYQ